MLSARTKVLPTCTKVLPADFILADCPPDFVSADNVVELLSSCTEVLCTTEMLPAKTMLQIQAVLSDEMLQCRPLQNC